MTERAGKRQKGGGSSPTPAASAAGAGSSPLDAVSELLAERAKYDKWLTDLEAKRTAGTTSQKAYEKVKADYQGRLDAVLEKLSTHASAMEAHAVELETRLKKFAESEAELEESREEAQLRNEVGELDDEAWEALSKKVERELSKIKQDKEVASSDLEKIRGLLATATPAGGTAKIEEKGEQKGEQKDEQNGERKGDEVEVAVLPQAEAAPAPQSSAGAPPETPARTKEMDELEFLKSVVGTTPAGSAPPPQPRPSGAMPKPEAPAVKAAPLIKPPPAKPAPAKSAPPIEQLVEQPKDEPLIGKGKGSMPVPDANPITIKPAAGGGVAQTKTLKCAECGALNYPSEWYCERCGA
ncbi:MAG TPA: hypothetical protein VF048_12845, partial [Gemmatimonadaceae bacterium]